MELQAELQPGRDGTEEGLLFKVGLGTADSGSQKIPIGIHEIHGRKLVRHPSSCASPLVCVEKTWFAKIIKLLQAKFFTALLKIE